MAKKSAKPKSKKTPAAKKTAKKPSSVKRPTKSSRLKAPHNNTPTDDIVAKPVRLPAAWEITKASANTIWQYRKLFGGITLIYATLNLILVQGLASSSSVESVKSQLTNVFSGHLSSAGSSIAGFISLVGTSGSGSAQTGNPYQLFLSIVTSLAVIWALRQIFSGTFVRIRDTYYHGMYPLIPFILVLLLIGVQLLPFLIGTVVYSLVIVNGIAVHPLEQLITTVVFILLSAATIYMLSSSVFALYIVTLPDMTPLKALRSAKELVRKRRLVVVRKSFFLPLVLLLASALVMVPIIIVLTVLAQWAFFLMAMFALVAIHVYMYTFYRELLNE